MKTALDLFSGTGSATKAFQEHPDWNVVRVEKDPELVEEYGAEIQADILQLEPKDFPTDVDFIWASPPCTDFSIACCAQKWTKTKMPKVKSISHSVKLVYHTLWLIQELNPEYWFLENPQGLMRKITPFPPTGTVTYCQYGTDYMKPTDLYGHHPESMEYRRCGHGDKCHIYNPREKNEFRDATRKTKDMDGTQATPKIEKRSAVGKQTSGSNREVRSKVPYELSKAILEAVENPGKRTKQVKLDATH